MHDLGLRCVRALSFAWMIGAMSACSLLIETRDQQCTKDSDCSQLEGTVCDLSAHVCVKTSGASGSSSSSSGGGADAGCGGEDGSCYSCPPTDGVDKQFLNQCTDAKCKAFDNETRLQNLTADGGLPPLP